MASDYGLNFGFRRSDESLRVSEGRFRTPASGPILLQGTCVEIDPAAPGFLRVGAANVAPRTGTCGLLVQEEVWDRSFYEREVVDSFELGKTKKNRLSVLTNGAGVKVWFQNTAAQTRADGRVIDSVTIVNLTGVAVGDQLGWSGTTWVKVDGTTITEGHMEVTEVDTAKGYVEAVLLK